MIKTDYDDAKTFFTATIPVLVTHLNYGNHLGYDSLLTIIQDARMYWLKKHDMGEASISETVGYIIKELIVDYKSEGFHGDNLLVELYTSEITKTSFVFEYKVSNSLTQRIVATAKTKQIFFDYSTRKVSKTPEKFTNAVLESEKKTPCLA
jgi:acyl-CoA thioester hydrolase